MFQRLEVEAEPVTDRGTGRGISCVATGISAEFFSVAADFFRGLLGIEIVEVVSWAVATAS